MEHDTELAVVGVAGGGVDVRHLHQRKHRQQHNAQDGRGYGKSPRPGRSASSVLEEVQGCNPVLQGYTG